MSCAGGCGGKCGPCRVKKAGAALSKTVGSVFGNYTGRPTQARFLRQMKPNVGTYAWLPNTSTSKRTAPYEKGATFQNIGRSGVGGVGTASAAAAATGAETTDSIGKRS